MTNTTIVLLAISLSCLVCAIHNHATQRRKASYHCVYMYQKSEGVASYASMTLTGDEIKSGDDLEEYRKAALKHSIYATQDDKLIIVSFIRLSP